MLGEEFLIPGRFEVVFDDSRHTHTDRNGLYVFLNVSYGPHQVEVVFRSERPFFFPTASRVETEVNATVNFGIGFALSRLLGYVRNDAGEGMGGVGISINRGQQRLSVLTNGEGKFSAEGLPAGEYEVGLNVDSIPPGYSLAGLRPKWTTVEAPAPGRVEFILRAIRSISGRARIYERTSGRQVPVKGLRVRLRELSRESITDEDGTYLFRDLPAGGYTIVVTYQGREFTREVTLPASPAFLRAIDIYLSLQ